MIGKLSKLALIIMLCAIYGLFTLWLISDAREKHLPYIDDHGSLIVDHRPSFLDYNVSEYHFVANFVDINIADKPDPDNMLTYKNLTKIYVFMSDKNVSVLPTTNYQAIYVNVSAGFAQVHIHMCPEQYVFGGAVFKGWNIIALDFQKLLQLVNCSNFNMETDRPKISFMGIGTFYVWKMDHLPTVQDYYLREGSIDVGIRMKYSTKLILYTLILVVFCVFFIFICAIEAKRRIANINQTLPDYKVVR